MKETARKEERKRKRVWIRSGRIDEVWWRWDEDEEVLKNSRGNVRETRQEEGGEEGKGE